MASLRLPRRRRRGRAALFGPRRASASSRRGRSASVHSTSRDVGHALAEQQPLFVRGEDVLRRRPDQRVESEQVVHQLRTAQNRPHPLERGTNLRRGPQAIGEVLFPLLRRRLTTREQRRDGHVVDRDAILVRGHQRPPVLAPEVIDDEAGDVRTPFVVVAAPRAGALDDSPSVTTPQAEPVAVDRDERRRAASGARGR